jgi:hypothetical protein
MKRFLFVATIVLFAVSAQASDVNVSVSVGQPGFYGRIDIGGAPPPEVIYARPVTVRPPPGPPPAREEPLYLRVPPGHQKKWSKHCGQYNACGRPVYFVKDKWYNNVYVPHYRERHRDRDRNEYRHENRRDYDRDRARRHDRDDRGRGPDRDDRDDRGRGRGRN